jgi:hypothetical protein
VGVVLRASNLLVVAWGAIHALYTQPLGALGIVIRRRPVANRERIDIPLRLRTRFAQSVGLAVAWTAGRGSPQRDGVYRDETALTTTGCRDSR